MSTAGTIEGTWISKINGKLFLINFSGEDFQLVFQLPKGTSISTGKFTVNYANRPTHIDFTVTDGIGKDGDRLRARSSANVVRGIIDHEGDVLRFFAPPPELEVRPTAFPAAEPGLVGPNIYVVLKRAA
jgi:hypothetical protein